MRPVNITALSAANVANDQASAAIVTDFVVSVSAQAVITGSTPHGTFKLQGSNDVAFSPATPTNWNDIGTPISVTTTGIYLIPSLDICYAFVRAVWLKSSGTGAISVQVKTVGY